MHSYAAWVSEGLFVGWAKSEISFFLLETKKTTFFAKTVIEKRKISKSRGPPSLPTLMSRSGFAASDDRI